MMCDVRRVAQVILSIWFAAATTFFQACVPPPSNTAYQGTVQTVSSVGNSALSTGNLSANSGVVNASTASTSFDATGYSQDPSKSQALTSYLQQHRLPLVGAQVMENRSGDRAVVLYGFVATPFGKSDAANKARSFLKDPELTVANRIDVRPELLSSSGSSQYSGSASTSNPPSNSAPNMQDYADQQNAIQQYEQQQNALQQYQGQPQQNSALSTMLPLLAIVGMLSMGSFGGSGFGGGVGFGGFGAGPGGYPPGYPGVGYPGYPGPAPYSPYPGYGSPFSPYP
jgi:hypothetical protein